VRSSRAPPLLINRCWLSLYEQPQFFRLYAAPSWAMMGVLPKVLQPAPLWLCLRDFLMGCTRSNCLTGNRYYDQPTPAPARSTSLFVHSELFRGPAFNISI